MQQQQRECVIEVLEAPKAAAGTAAGVLARLAEREQERTATAAKRLDELRVGADPRESVNAFLEDFAAQRQQLEAALQAVAVLPGGGAAELSALAGQLTELEKAVADAAYFLPAYDLRQATLALGALREQHEAATAALQPRKRFAFSRKASASSPADVSTAMPDSATRSSNNGTQAAAPSESTQQQEQQEAAQPNKQQQRQSPQDQQPQEQRQQSSSGSTISGLRGRVLAVSREEAAGKEFTLSDLEDCTVYLLAPLAALFLHQLRRCRVYTGPVAGACFVEGAESSLLMIAARQVRVHSASSSDFYLRVRSHPIIEHSDGLRFAPYAPAYPGAQRDLEEQGLHQDGDAMWRQVNDFGWLRATPSPHWSVLPEGERAAAPAAAEATLVTLPQMGQSSC